MSYDRKVRRRKVRGIRNWMEKRAGVTRTFNRAAEKREWKRET